MHPSETPLTHACMDDVCTRIDDRLKWMEVRFLKTFVSQHILPSPLLSVLVPWQRWMRL